MLLQSLRDGAVHLAARRRGNRARMALGIHMHQYLSKARARLQLQDKLIEKVEQQASKTDLSRMVTATSGPTEKEKELQRQIERLLLDMRKPIMVDGSTQMESMRKLPTPATPSKRTPVPPPSLPDPTNVAMWVNRRERCQVFKPTTAGFRRPRNQIACSGAHTLTSSQVCFKIYNTAANPRVASGRHAGRS